MEVKSVELSEGEVEQLLGKMLAYARLKLLGSRPMVRLDAESNELVNSAWKSFEIGDRGLYYDGDLALERTLFRHVRRKVNRGRRRARLPRGRQVDPSIDTAGDWLGLLKDDDPSVDVMMNLRVREIQEVVENIDDPQGREVARLRLMGFENKAAAEELGINLRKVERLAAAARSCLRRNGFGPEGDE